MEANFNEDYKAGFSDGYDMGEQYTKDELIKYEWINSPERQEAWLKFTAKQFDQSQEFANARHAFRKRMNG